MGKNYEANQERFDQLNPKGLSSRQLRWLVTASLDELQRRRSIPEMAQDAYYPDDVANTYAQGAANCLDALNNWMGRLWLCWLLEEHTTIICNQGQLRRWQKDYLRRTMYMDEIQEAIEEGSDAYVDAKDHPELFQLLREIAAETEEV